VVARGHEFDLTIRSRFLAAYEAAASGELAAWEENEEGALALVLLLDQFSRNMFRDDARAFATDAVADLALARGFDQSSDPAMRQFFYLPLMHFEVLVDQDRCVDLYAALADAELMRYARDHRDMIQRFGRFPGRNRPLGREAMSAEHEPYECFFETSLCRRPILTFVEYATPSPPRR
jgi:uncharacterized protein (DUF924 family)